MTDTNRLSPVTSSDTAGADLLRLWSQKLGGDTRLTLAVLAEYLQGALTFPSALTPVYEAPTASGFSVSLDAANSWLILTPSAGYAAGTIVLPSGFAGDEILVNCTQAVAALTLSAATGDSAIGAPTSLAANDFFRLRFDGVLSRWYRVG